MDVPVWVWVVSLVGLIGILITDLLIIARRPHEPSLRESTAWVTLYVSLAVAFGLVVWAGFGPTYAGEFYAGWLVEYSLSMDNLFVFLLIMSHFAVPREHQQKVLLLGIVLALVMRAAFIVTGAQLIKLIWVFYLFGLFLVLTGIRLARHRGDDPEQFKENAVVRLSRRVLPMTRDYQGARLTIMEDGRRLFTPLVVVLIVIGTTDLVFAVDSIPAIFGVTREAYLVIAANVFALMGLRQLYFLIGGLVRRLVYLTAGLGTVLVFIGGKMIVEALAENNVPFINGGEHVSWAPHVPIWLSLAVIGVILGGTAAASLLRTAYVQRRLAVTGATPATAASGSGE